jgi:hypothetical protein
MAVTEAALPDVYGLIWPTLKAIRALGGFGDDDLINRVVIQREHFARCAVSARCGSEPGAGDVLVATEKQDRSDGPDSVRSTGSERGREAAP